MKTELKQPPPVLDYGRGDSMVTNQVHAAVEKLRQGRLYELYYWFEYFGGWKWWSIAGCCGVVAWLLGWWLVGRLEPAGFFGASTAVVTLRLQPNRRRW